MVDVVPSIVYCDARHVTGHHIIQYKRIQGVKMCPGALRANSQSIVYCVLVSPREMCGDVWTCVQDGALLANSRRIVHRDLCSHQVMSWAGVTPGSTALEPALM